MDYETTTQVETGALGALLVVYFIVLIAIYVITVIGLWKMYVKAGRPGWAAIIPVYNWWVWVEMIGRPRWWFWALVASLLLSWIPIVGIILSILMFVLYLMGCLDMAKAFGKGAGTGIGLWLVPFVFAPILGFGDGADVLSVAASAGGGGVGVEFVRRAVRADDLRLPLHAEVAQRVCRVFHRRPIRHAAHDDAYLWCVLHCQSVHAGGARVNRREGASCGKFFLFTCRRPRRS